MFVSASSFSFTYFSLHCQINGKNVARVLFLFPRGNEECIRVRACARVFLECVRVAAVPG